MPSTNDLLYNPGSVAPPYAYPARLQDIVSYARLDVTRRNLARLRHACRAVGDGVGAAGAEDAARGRVDRARDVALEDDALALAVGVGDRHGGEQRLGIGVLRAAAERVARRALHDAAEIHDDDAVGDVLDDGEVVGDEKQRKAEPAAE